MTEPVRPIALLPGETPSRWRTWRAWLLRTVPGRALVLGLVIKAITWPTTLFSVLPSPLEAIDMVGSLALLFAAAYGISRLGVWAKRRLLWRVRRKLILSYVFVGVVPAMLVITFFLLAGLILLFNVSSYLVQSRVRSLTDQARFLAQTAVARSAAQHHDRGAARDDGAPAVERWKRAIRSSRSRSCRSTGCTCEVEPARAATRAEDAARGAAGARRPVGPSRSARPAAQVGRLRRVQRHRRLRPAGRPRPSRPTRRGRAW